MSSIGATSSSRLHQAQPCATVAPSIDALPVGAHVLEVNPVRQLGASGSAWYRAVNGQVAEIDRLIATDPSLRAVGSYQEARSRREPYSPVIGELFQRIPGARSLQLTLGAPPDRPDRPDRPDPPDRPAPHRTNRTNRTDPDRPVGSRPRSAAYWRRYGRAALAPLLAAAVVSVGLALGWQGVDAARPALPGGQLPGPRVRPSGTASGLAVIGRSATACSIPRSRPWPGWQPVTVLAAAGAALAFDRLAVAHFGAGGRARGRGVRGQHGGRRAPSASGRSWPARPSASGACWAATRNRWATAGRPGRRRLADEPAGRGLLSPWPWSPGSSPARRPGQAGPGGVATRRGDG